MNTLPRTTFAAFTLLLAAAAATPASAQSRPQSGTLACDMGPSIGLIVGSRQHLKCVFTNSATGHREAYAGRIGRLGLDLGVTAGGKMVWGVYAKTTQIAPRALVGDYVGASGDISL